MGGQMNGRSNGCTDLGTYLELPAIVSSPLLHSVASKDPREKTQFPLHIWRVILESREVPSAQMQGLGCPLSVASRGMAFLVNSLLRAGVEVAGSDPTPTNFPDQSNSFII